MVETRAKEHLRHRLCRLGHLVGNVPERSALRTPDADEWAETSLSRRQLDVTLRKGFVHRHHGQP
jgi:hypothetical protein